MHRRSLLPLVAGVLAAPTAFAWPGQPVVVDNVAGAPGSIGSQQVARARPDGLTLMSSVDTLVMNASLFKNLPCDPVTDFAPIGLTAWGSLVLVANPAQAPDTLAELVTAAKASPHKLTCGSPGVGTPHRLSMALVEQACGIELLHVPYKSTAGAVQDLPGGQIGFMFLPVHVSAQHIRGRKLKAVAAGSPGRLPQLPDVPTLIEAGLVGADVDMWYGPFAPRATPAPLVERLNREVADILGSADAGTVFEAQGMVPTTSTPYALETIVVRDRKRWTEVVASRGITAE